jgi:deoxyribodipyrimidine photolyase-related protein
MLTMRATIWILGDQLLPTHPALAAAHAAGATEMRIVMVESASRMARLPYHRKKLVLLLAAMRHYAALLRSQGYAVDYIRAPTVSAGLRQHAAEFQPDRIITMAAAEIRWPPLSAGAHGRDAGCGGDGAAQHAVS